VAAFSPRVASGFFQSLVLRPNIGIYRKNEKFLTSDAVSIKAGL